MNTQDSRKIIVAGAMAVVVGIAVVTYAMRPHPVATVAGPITPPAPAAELTPAPAAVAQVPETPAAPVTPAAPAAVAPPPVVETPAPARHREVAATKRTTTRSTESVSASTFAPKAASTQPAMSADSSAVVTANSVTPAAPAPDLSMKDAASTVATTPDATSSVAATASATTPATTPAATADASAPTSEQTPAVAATAVPATDSQITTAVKSQIASDSLVKDTPIAVTTTNGVVALSGTVPTQDAIDHVKIVVASVKDVKSVDTSALTVPNL